MAILKIVPITEVGSTLREIRREAKGFTNQQELATKMNKAIVTISKFENNGNFSRDQLIDYCQFLGLGTPYVVFAMDEEDVKRLLNVQP